MTCVLPADAAAAAEVQPGTLRVWVHRGQIRAKADGRYDIAEIIAWSARRSHRHAVSARHQRGTKRGGACKPGDDV